MLRSNNRSLDIWTMPFVWTAIPAVLIGSGVGIIISHTLVAVVIGGLGGLGLWAVFVLVMVLSTQQE